MPQHIFFSWQADRPALTGRNLVQRALERAIAAIAADATIDPAVRELAVDRDTARVPGSPPLVDTIFAKVDDATAFLSDLTYVAERADGRRMPNPNVLLEHGYALKALSWRAVIAVMNIAHGHPDQQPLPFDLQHFRRPMFYDCPDGADEAARSAARDGLARQLETALRAILADDVLRAAKAPERPAEPHPEDIELFTRFRQLMTPGHHRFLRTESFRGPLRRDKLTPVYELAEDWIGVRHEFHDAVIQTAFAQVRRAADTLYGLTNTYLSPSDTMVGMLTPLTGRDQAQGTQPSTVRAIGEMEAAATELADAIDDFERIARDRIRVPANQAADGVAEREDLVRRATDILTELVQDRALGRLPGIVSQPSMTLRAMPLASLDRARLDAGQVAQAQLRFPPNSDVRVETGSDGRQWWSIEPPRDVGKPNPESRWRTRLVRPGAIEFEVMFGERLDDDPEIVVDGLSLEADIVKSFERLGAALAELQLDGPALISIAFDGTEDVMLARSRPGGRKIRQPGFALPLLVVDTLTEGIGDALHDAFDRMWQTAGWPDGSPSFASGRWTAGRA